MMETKEKKRGYTPNAGHLLMAVAVLALVVANTPLDTLYQAIWQHGVSLQVGNFNLLSHAGKPLSLLDFINDALMALFFFYVAQEVKIAMKSGPLSNFRSASLPVIAAIGGVVVPIIIYFIFNLGKPTERGVAIPMATDIAFSLGVLSLFGNRVPSSLKLFLATLAIADDIFGILVIAFFYSSHLAIGYLLAAIVPVILILFSLKTGVRTRWWYYLLSLSVWHLFLQSGVHATMAGVLLAFILPEGLLLSTHRLERFVDFFVLPLFAFANAGIQLTDGGHPIEGSVLWGVMLGLVVGKPVGIFLFAHLAVLLKASVFPKGFTNRYLLGAALLGGVGFTVSLFIASLSFKDNEVLLHEAKLGVLSGTVIAGLLGYFYLKIVLRHATPASQEPLETSAASHP